MMGEAYDLTFQSYNFHSLQEDVSKEGRKSMHGAIREHFPNLESSTEDSEGGGKKIIVQRGATSRKG